MYRSFVTLFSTVVLLLVTAPRGVAADPAVTCESGKLKVAGKYGACVLGADSKAVKTNTTPDYSKCDAKYSLKWQGAESKAGMGVCPSEGDEVGIQAFLDTCSQAVADALAGGILLSDVVSCNADLGICITDLGACNTDLATCEGDLVTTAADLVNCASDLAACEAQLPAQILKTGQTTCYNTPGAAVACPGTGQDGQTQYGLSSSYTDNGDGTVTDNNTGLMWEKLSDDGSIHDQDTSYTWANAFSVKIANLNASSFAGHNDWRLPNIRELESIKNFATTLPAVDPVFDNACVGGCTVLGCSCTRSNTYWSSTTHPTSTAAARMVYFSDADTGFANKGTVIFVRGVRGGV